MVKGCMLRCVTSWRWKGKCGEGVQRCWGFIDGRFCGEGEMWRRVDGVLDGAFGFLEAREKVEVGCGRLRCDLRVECENLKKNHTLSRKELRRLLD